MAPHVPTQIHNFTADGTNSPGDRLDAQFQDHALAITDTQDALKQIRRADGKLQNWIVTKDTLHPSIVTALTKDIRKDVSLDVETIRSGAVSAQISAQTALKAADSAQQDAQEAKNAAEVLNVNAGSILTRIKNALASLLDVETRTIRAVENTAKAVNDATYEKHLASEYATVSAAWAEHLPDTIPPNILAVAGITGEHWSSRWWAHRAGTVVKEEIKNLCGVYVGAFNAPPSKCSHGDPLATGTMYWNTQEQVMYLWNGTAWQRLVLPSPGKLQEFHYTSVANQTIFGGVDIFGRTPVDLASLSVNVNVHLNGVRLVETLDWSIANNNQISISAGPAPGSIVTIETLSAPSTTYAATAATIDVSMWTFDGVTKTFNIHVDGALYTPPNAANLLVSLDGVVQNPGVTFTVSGSKITFKDAPRAESVAWGLVGVPIGASGGGTVGGYQDHNHDCGVFP